jgi:hypothetical protein
MSDNNGNGDKILDKLMSSKLGYGILIGCLSLLVSYFTWLGYNVNDISFTLIKHGDQIENIGKNLDVSIANVEKKLGYHDLQIGTIINVENTLASELAALKAAQHQQEVDENYQVNKKN